MARGMACRRSQSRKSQPEIHTPASRFKPQPTDTSRRAALLALRVVRARFGESDPDRWTVQQRHAVAAELIAGGVQLIRVGLYASTTPTGSSRPPSRSITTLDAKSNDRSRDRADAAFLSATGLSMRVMVVTAPQTCCTWNTIVRQFHDRAPGWRQGVQSVQVISR